MKIRIRNVGAEQNFAVKLAVKSGSKALTTKNTLQANGKKNIPEYTRENCSQTTAERLTLIAFTSDSEMLVPGGMV